ncbi:MAG TPA: alpha/beta fold hydrolase [Candidatus Limnocylindrales bacterium]|nr:alpha/beta fold hydrolase [Candidatus Limnocylindrales bacterium]
MTTRRIAGPAGALNVDDGGQGGLSVILLHGFGGNTTHWAAQLDHLRLTRRAVAMDLRAHGGSDRPADGDFAVESQTADVAAVLDALEIDRAVLVGHSLGGAIAIAAAGAHPERVAGLALVAAPGKVPEEQAGQVIGAMEADYEKTAAGYWEQLTAGARPAVADQIRGERNALDAETGLAIIKATFAFDPVPALGRYRGPKIAIVTPRGTAPHDLQNLVADLPHRVVEGTSHFLQMDDPDTVNAILDEFLATVESGAPGQRGPVVAAT